MEEVWLYSNRRVLLLAMVPVVVCGAVGMAIWGSDASPLLGWLGGGCFVIACLFFLGLFRQVWQPRIAYRAGHVLFFLNSGDPLAVPLKVVEAFFQGESLAHLPGETRHQAKSVNLIVRLAQRETDWQEREVKPALGKWSEGYITVRGTWCEPINAEVIRRLNQRLSEVTKAWQSEGGVAT